MPPSGPSRELDTNIRGGNKHPGLLISFSLRGHQNCLRSLESLAMSRPFSLSLLYRLKCGLPQPGSIGQFFQHISTLELSWSSGSGRRALNSGCQTFGKPGCHLTIPSRELLRLPGLLFTLLDGRKNFWKCCRPVTMRQDVPPVSPQRQALDTKPATPQRGGPANSHRPALPFPTSGSRSLTGPQAGLGRRVSTLGTSRA